MILLGKKGVNGKHRVFTIKNLDMFINMGKVCVWKWRMVPPNWGNADEQVDWVVFSEISKNITTNWDESSNEQSWRNNLYESGYEPMVSIHSFSGVSSQVWMWKATVKDQVVRMVEEFHIYMRLLWCDTVIPSNCRKLLWTKDLHVQRWLR